MLGKGWSAGRLRVKTATLVVLATARSDAISSSVAELSDALDPERKAAMISNLLVVLVGDREVTPVINTGTLYS